MPVNNFKLKLEIDGLGATERNLKEIAYRAMNAKPVLRKINYLMQRGAWEQFSSEGSRGGTPWLKDKMATVKKKAAAGEDQRTERASRDLEASLLAGGADNIKRLSAHATTYGTRLHYARFQGHKRRLLQVTGSDANLWTKMIVEYILSGDEGRV